MCVCRDAVLLHEHTRKPIQRAALKAAVLGVERKDPGGRLTKVKENQIADRSHTRAQRL